MTNNDRDNLTNGATDWNTSHVLHNSLVSQPPTVTSASGTFITLCTGQTVLDGCTGAAVACIGHGNVDVQTAVFEQMSKVCYTHTVAFTTTAAEDLADLLLEGNTYGLSRAFFVCSGSEATDSALKLARQYHVENNQPERTRIVARRRAFHGNTVGAMSVGSHIARRAPYEGALLLDNVSYVSPTYAYRDQLEGESEAAYTERLVQELDEEFRALGPETVMAFISEPVGGATAGCLTAPRGYYQGVRRLCDKYGILLILDEVMCGTGRTGTFFAFEQEGDGVYPDLLTLGKGLGGGYAPIAGVLAHSKVIDVLQKGTGTFIHSFTYQAHGVSCAAALAVQKVLRRDNLVLRCAAKGKWLEDALKTTFNERKYVGDIRGKGLFWGMEFVRDKSTKVPFAPEVGFTYKIVEEALRRGLCVYPGAGTVDGARGDHVIIAPPYNASDGELTSIVSLLREAYEAVEKRIV
ncbi:pyridoxal phosphate-dependent transferase [Aspergillus minisclerotigenes]|uniref:Pyridoxal phosphate-dependent transferase n=1 Tax=Aspergillus minisclerotigenes TaxID=656917 RepID=A0A5N6JAP7_9EURO|nr:pyridoxal phosphate-dependent transferase [Aspergillus minisclerotigenes]